MRKVFRCLQGVRFWECVECGELFCSEHAGRDPRVPRRHAQRNYRFLCCPKCGGEKRTQKPSFGSPGSGV